MFKAFAIGVIVMLTGCSALQPTQPIEPGLTIAPPVCSIEMALGTDCADRVGSSPNCNTYAMQNYDRLRKEGLPVRFIFMQNADGRWHMAVTDGKMVWSNQDKPVPWNWMLVRQWGGIEDMTTEIWHQIVAN